MKKFNLHEIMTTAHKIRKASGLCMSEALKRAWRIAKAMLMGARIWEKGDKCRLYLNSAGEQIVGLKYDTYKSGMISSSQLNGEEISHASAIRILTSLSGSFVDLKSWSITVAPSLPEEYRIVKDALAAAFAP